jgi:hypothetical protein
MKQLNTLKPRFKGPSGKEVLLRTSVSHLQWMLQGDTDWQNLASLDELAPNKMSKTGGVFTGPIQVRSIVETIAIVSIYTGTAVFDMSVGNVFNLQMTEDVSALDIGNIPSGDVVSFTLLVTQNNSEAKTLNWAGSNIPIKWPGNAAPVLTTDIGKTDIYTLLTIDQGVSFFGFVSGQVY